MTDKLREAAQQALEILECIDSEYWHDFVEGPITTLRAALAEQPAEQDKTATMQRIVDSHTEFVRKHTAPQPTKPAEQVELETVYKTIIQWGEGGGKRSRRELAQHIVSLYPAPQPAKRKPLTDDEIIRVGINTKSAEPGRAGYILPVTFATAVIAAYEAKNGITGETK